MSWFHQMTFLFSFRTRCFNDCRPNLKSVTHVITYKLVLSAKKNLVTNTADCLLLISIDVAERTYSPLILLVYASSYTHVYTAVPIHLTDLICWLTRFL